MSATTTPNMGLTAPGVGNEPGPAWAQEVNGDLSILDGHNHSQNQGVQIQPNGININADLPFNSNNATLLRTARFVSQGSPITNAAPDVGCLYVSGNELYYNDVSGGHQVQITTSGSVNSGAGSITGLPSGTASASFSGGTFVWQSATSTPATMDMGTIIVRDTTASGKGVTISAPSALANNYSLALPSGNAGFNGSMLTSDISGTLSYTVADDTTISWLAGILAVGTIQTSNIAANAVTRPKLAAVGQQTASISLLNFNSTTVADLTGLSISITTSGRPVVVFLQPQGNSLTSVTGSVVVAWGAGSGSLVNFYLVRGATRISNAGNVQTQSGSQILNGNYLFLDAPAAGTYTYKMQGIVGNAGDTITFQNYTFVAYEL